MMRILLDENLPTDLIEVLRALGHDVEHVCSRQLSGHPDSDVRALAQSERRLLITQDIRFAGAPEFTTSIHSGLILVRLKRPGLRAVLDKVRAVFESADVDSWRGCFVVISDSKLRIRRPRE